MFTEDFLLRQIAQAAAAITKVLGLSKAGKFQESYVMIDQAIEELLGLNAGIAKHMDDASLVSLLTIGKSTGCGKLLALADLFKAEGDVLAVEKHDSESQSSYQRALNLYYEFSTHCSANTEIDVLTKITELQKKIIEKK